MHLTGHRHRMYIISCVIIVTDVPECQHGYCDLRGSSRAVSPPPGQGRRCPHEYEQLGGSRRRSRGGPTPAGDRHGDGCGPRSRAGPAYLDKMQIHFTPLVLTRPFSLLSRSLGQIRGRPLGSARAESPDSLLDSGHTACAVCAPPEHISFYDPLLGLYLQHCDEVSPLEGT